MDLERTDQLELLPDRETSTKRRIGLCSPWGGNRDEIGQKLTKVASGRAPAAIQVADRFHLLQNLAETLDQALGAHSQTS